MEVRKYTGTEAFHTDIRYVFGFLQREEKKEVLAAYINEHREAFEELSEDAYDMISVMSHSEELLKSREENIRKGACNMCKAIKDMIEDGRKEGLQEGLQKGREQGMIEGVVQGRFEMLCLLVTDGVIEMAEAARRMEMPMREFQERMAAAK